MENDQFSQEIYIEAKPEKIFSALTTPEELTAWWGDNLGLTAEIAEDAEDYFYYSESSAYSAVNPRIWQDAGVTKS